MKKSLVLLAVLCSLLFPFHISAHAGAYGALNHLGWRTITISVTAALIDAFNPTAIAVLLFILQTKQKTTKNIWGVVRSGVLYVVGVVLMYLIAAYAINLVLQTVGPSLITETFQLLLAFLLFLAGIKEVSDSLHQNWLPQTNVFIETLFSKLSFFSHGVWPLVLGLAMGLFELFLTGAVYLNFVRLITYDPTVHAGVLATFLGIYVFVFVLPLIATIILVTINTSVSHFFEKRKRSLEIGKVIIGIAFVAVSIWLSITSLNIILSL